jgi:hypothetical protein
MLVMREMTELEGEVWDHPVGVPHRRLVSHPRKGVLEDSLTNGVFYYLIQPALSYVFERAPTAGSNLNH